MVGVNDATGQTLSNADEILKDFYLGPVREQLNYSSVLMYRIYRDEESVTGRQVIIPVHTGRNEGISGVSDGGFLPDPGFQTWENLKFPVRYMYGRLLLTGPTISAAKNDRGAFLRTLDAAVKGLTRDFKKDCNRILHGEGSGILAAETTLVASGTGLTTMTIAHPWATTPGRIGQFLKPNMQFGMIPTTSSSSNKDDATVIGANEVSSYSGTTLTVKTAYDIGDTGYAASTKYYLVRCARFGADSQSTQIKFTSAWKEAQGLRSVCDDGNAYGESTFQNLDTSVAANAFFRSKVTAVGGDITFSALQTMFDDIEQEGDGARPSLIIGDYIQRRKYYELWNNPTGSGNNPAASRRFVNTMTLDGGFSAVEFNGVPLVADTDATPKVLYFLDESQLAIFRNEDFFWLDRDGKVLHRLEDKDAYQATLACYWEFGTYRRNAHGRLETLGE